MTFDDDAFNRLAPASLWKPDWADALERAGELDQRRREPWVRRRRILALAAVVVVLTALIALGAENARWFFEF